LGHDVSFFNANVDNGDVRAFGRESQRARPTNTVRTAGHNNRLALKPSHFYFLSAHSAQNSTINTAQQFCWNPMCHTPMPPGSEEPGGIEPTPLLEAIH
jgi:hypothetical protein